MTPFSDHINTISFDICHCYDFFIGVLAVYLIKTMVIQKVQTLQKELEGNYQDLEVLRSKKANNFKKLEE